MSNGPLYDTEYISGNMIKLAAELGVVGDEWLDVIAAANFFGKLSLLCNHSLITVFCVNFNQKRIPNL